MADEQASPPSVDVAAPATPPADQVQIGLGPDLGIYPHELRPAEPKPEAPAPAPEAAEAEPSEPPDQAAGPASEQTPQGSRRRANEDAYQRGLAEGRAAIEREQVLAKQQQQFADTQREATERVEKLFADL